MPVKEIKLKWLIQAAIVITIVYMIVTQTKIWSVIGNGLAPIIYALVIAYMMDYSVRLFEVKFKIKRGLSILITLIVFAFIIALTGLIVIPRILDAVTSLIGSVSNLNIDFNWLNKMTFDNDYLVEFQSMLMDALKPFIQNVTNATGVIVLVIVKEMQKFTSGIINFLVALIIAIYMLGEKKELLARMKRVIFAFFTDEISKRIYYIAHLSNKIFMNFFVGKLLDSSIIGILSFVIFKVFGFEYAMLIAVIIGITNMIPYFGPFIGAVPAVIITFVATPSEPLNMLWMLLIIFVIQQLDGWVIGPFILSDSVGVSAFWIVIAVTVGGAAFGITGMFLGVPGCVLIKTLLEDEVETRLHSKGYKDFETEHIKVVKTKHQFRNQIKK